MNKNIIILKADPQDAENIIKLQKAAYQQEAALYDDFLIPPLTETSLDVQELCKTNVILKAVFNGNIVGSVRGCLNGDTCYVGRLGVAPKMQGQGVGSCLMVELEKLFSCERFELFVGDKSLKNISLYQKLGYVIFKKGKHGCGANINIFYMEKIMSSND